MDDEFARNCWHVAAASNDIGSTRPSAVTVAGEPLVMFRAAAGGIIALEDRCPHRHAPLSLGCVEARGIRCMYHGMLFAPDGSCLEIPGQDRIPPRARVASYPVSDRHGWIWVWIGDEPADASLMPPAVAGDHPNWITAQGSLDYDANYRLLIDNLLDFSHLSYVHAASFRADRKWSEIRPSVTRLPRGVHVERWIPRAPALMSARYAAGQLVDTWQGYDFLAPGVLVMETLYCQPGTAEAAGWRRPDDGVIVRNAASQAVTATTSRTSRYFYAVALPAGDGDQEICDHILSVSQSAFLEDKEMIEAQQQRIDQAPDRPVIPTAADAAISIFHAILRRLSRTSDAETSREADPDAAQGADAG